MLRYHPNVGKIAYALPAGCCAKVLVSVVKCKNLKSCKLNYNKAAGISPALRRATIKWIS